MSFSELIAELPALTTAERQQLISKAIELDDHGLSNADKQLIEQRLTDHQNNPDSAVDVQTMKERLRRQFPNDLAD